MWVSVCSISSRRQRQSKAQENIGERGGGKRDSRVGPKKEKKEKHIERGGKRENIFILHYFKRNCINSRLQKYEPTRFRFLGNSNRNQFRLPPTLTGKSPNPTGTLTLFLGLCPTQLATALLHMYVICPSLYQHSSNKKTFTTSNISFFKRSHHILN